MPIAGHRHLHMVLDEDAANYSQHRPDWARNLRPQRAAEFTPGRHHLADDGEDTTSEGPWLAH